MHISELFYSVQGEGHLTGRPMYFIRAQGCAVKCPIRAVCDQPESLAFRGGTETSVVTLVTEALAACGPRGWVCLTGGEPAEQPDCEALIAACRQRGLFVQVQTSGMRRISAPVDWLTVSPKAPCDELLITTAHELKIIYTGQSVAELSAYYSGFRAFNYYLQPCWQDGETNQAETLDMVYRLNRAGMGYEFSAQWHKFLGVR